MLKKNILLTVGLSLGAALLTSPLRAEHPDFTGNWQLDVTNSTFAGSASPTAGNLVIDRRHKWLHATESFTLPQGASTKEFEWKLDDKIHPVDGPASGQVLARWDKGVLIGERRTGDGVEVETVTLSLAAPGTLVETLHRPEGTSTLTWKRQ